MATASAPTLGGVTLPVPKEQNYTMMYRGGALQMANGKIVHDLVDNAAHQHFSLRWEFLSEAQLTTVQTAWATVKNATAVYTTVRGASVTVSRPEGGEMEVTLVVTALGDIKYHASFELRTES